MKIALALGGGAGLGWAHIGVLRALDEAGIEIGALSGTSIGGVASVAYASGRLDRLEELALSATTVRSVLRYLGLTWKPGSVLSGKAIAKLIEENLGDLSFEGLDIPTVVVAADLVSGGPVVLDSGPVGEAIHATIALPGIFQPVVRDRRILSDGGAVMPVPVSALRPLAGDLPIVAVNLQGDYVARRRAVGLRETDDPKLTTLGVVRGATGLMLSNLARYSLDLDPPDLELAPKVGHIDTSNFTRAEELIEIGKASVIDSLDAIGQLSRQR